MLVPVPEQFRAPVGDNASKLTSKIGIEVQTQVPDLSVRRWKKVNDADKEPIIQRLTDNIIQTQAEHLSQTGAILLTPEELSSKVLKPRSGYVKGLGMRPSSSMKTTVAPVKNSDYVQRLEMQIAQQNEQIAKFQKSEKKQGKKIQSIIECLMQKGITGNFESGESSDSNGQAS